MTVRYNCLTYDYLESFDMPTLTVTAKGQITLNQDLLKHLGVTPGQKIEVHKLPNGKLMLGCHVRDGDIDDFIGCLHQPNMPIVTIEEMKEIITQGWADSS
jgi:antitoxin PrlF